ncbi:MAG: phage tail protein [Bryobacteraceae bacterium]|nr:phage tail protein [Bryobacteraceae bacterium]
MATIYEIKEREILDTPILLMECELHDGTVERWSSHGLTVGGDEYGGRILAHDLFAFKLGSEDGVDGSTRLSLRLANADSRFSQLERSIGFKGARLKVDFAFFDVKTGAPTSETKTVFRGVCTGVEEITEDTCRISFSNLLNLQRILFPTRRVQKSCPWLFPSTAAQREEASNGGVLGKYSLHYACGYSPDVPGGVGTNGPSGPFTDCSYTRSSCNERGMLTKDNLDRPTRRFGGIGFVPATTLVRSYGEREQRISAAISNEAKYNEAVPVVYGTGWFSPPIVFARNDGNLTRMEVLLGAGPVERVRKVIVNQVEIPVAEEDKDMTGTGWFTLLNAGERTGTFNPDFVGADGAPLGDPYGSTAYLSVAVPNAIASGSRLPRIDVLVDGLRLPRYDLDGTYLGEFFSANPAWILLDILRRSGWTPDDLDTASFAQASQHCDELIPAEDGEGNPIMLPRYRCNLILTRRRSVAEIVRGVKAAAGLYFVYGEDGRVRLRAEAGIAVQQAEKPAGSNAQETINGGWPAYEFGDGTYGFSGICRNPDGSPSLKLRSKPSGEIANRYTVEFQDEYNLYQHDTVSVVDLNDLRRTGYEVSSVVPVLGLPNSHQATRILRRQLDRALRGNLFVEFHTSVRGVSLHPGDIITLTYLKDGLNRTPFRILRITPDTDYSAVRLIAQLHEDGWYTDNSERLASGFGGGPAASASPRPLTGSVVDGDGFTAMEIAEQADQLSDGAAIIRLAAGFAPPTRPRSPWAPPTLGQSPAVQQTGGTLPGGLSYYYMITGVDQDGYETRPSVLVRADVPAGTSTNAVALVGLKWSQGLAAFHVYRGPDPFRLLRIASSVALAGTFNDSGLPPTAVPLPDENYDGANFYWRYELQPPVSATIVSTVTVGNGALSMTPGEFTGKRLIITEGPGRGQERTVAGHNETTITLSDPWRIVPDTSSKFAIAEAGWQFGATTKTSPGLIEVPNRKNLVVHVSGRARNASGIEAVGELALLTRWQIGGSAGSTLDSNPPPAPFFAIAPTGQGGVEVIGLSFGDLTDTRTVESGTIMLFYWDELSAPNSHRLSGGVSDTATTVTLSGMGIAQAGDLVQIGAELVTVTQVLGGGSQYEVQRGRFGTSAAAHAADADVFHLEKKAFVLSFPREFFGSPASGSYSHTIPLPDVRIAAAELYVTNVKGSSPTVRNNYTGTTNYGLRIHSGGQYTLQVEGFLAIQTGATPPLVISSSHAVRDVFARVADAPTGAPVVLRVKLDGTEYCLLTIPAGANVSNVVSGFNLRPLVAQGVLTLDVVSVGQAAETTPGRDLTVSIRL